MHANRINVWLCKLMYVNWLKGVLLEVKADFEEGVSVCIFNATPHCVHTHYTLLEVKCYFLKGSMFVFPSQKDKSLLMKTFVFNECLNLLQKRLLTCRLKEFPTVSHIKWLHFYLHDKIFVQFFVSVVVVSVVVSANKKDRKVKDLHWKPTKTT